MYHEDRRDPSRLVPEFWTRYQQALAQVARQGVNMKPYYMERSIFEQARLWRQSRSSSEVRNRIAHLENKGAKFMAHALNVVGSQPGTAGRHVTWVTLGWHQFGEACDAFWQVGGKAIWSTSRGGAQNGYRMFRTVCKSIGLVHLRGDFPHIQYRSAAPLKHMSYADADRAMELKFNT